jgi:hypothetical protein
MALFGFFWSKFILILPSLPAFRSPKLDALRNTVRSFPSLASISPAQFGDSVESAILQAEHLWVRGKV